MNIKPVMVAAAVLMTAALSPLYAQNAQKAQDTGFRIGTFQPQNPVAAPVSANPVQGMTTPPIQGMTTPPIQGMTTPPILPMGGGVVTQQPQRSFGGGIVNVLGPGEIVFVPAGTLVIENPTGQNTGAFLTAPSAPSTPQVPAAPTGGRGGRTQIQRPTRTPNTTGGTATQDSRQTEPTGLELGTARDKVIEKFGNPIAFLLGMNGETLYFNGGVVVFVKDGVVSTPGK
ncbi:MAG TPA: hypothetical protein VK210_09290 [Terriglobia bacterium]|nr:hypothetical protein [Terriglobia bacterium]